MMMHIQGADYSLALQIRYQMQVSGYIIVLCYAFEHWCDSVWAEEYGKNWREGVQTISRGQRILGLRRRSLTVSSSTRSRSDLAFYMNLTRNNWSKIPKEKLGGMSRELLEKARDFRNSHAHNELLNTDDMISKRKDALAILDALGLDGHKQLIELVPYEFRLPGWVPSDQPLATFSIKETAHLSQSPLHSLQRNQEERNYPLTTEPPGHQLGLAMDQLPLDGEV